MLHLSDIRSSSIAYHVVALIPIDQAVDHHLAIHVLAILRITIIEIDLI
jgi:hypothetical protein